MNFGIGFIPEMPAGQATDLARRAEDLGFDSLYIPDQTFYRDPFIVLALCAEATRRIRLGLAVTNPYTRHPIQIARAAGMIGEMSEGRFSLGFGAGNRPRVLKGFGLEQAAPAQRIREALTVTRRLLSGEEVEHRGDAFVVDRVGLDFKPGYAVPIFIASRGPQVLSLGGEIADAVMFEGLFMPGGAKWALSRIEDGARRRYPGQPKARTIAWQSLSLSDDESIAEAPNFRHWAALLISSTQPAVLEAIGLSAATIGAARREIAEVGVEKAGQSLSAEDIRKLVLVGTPEQVRARLLDLAGLGIDEVACIVLGNHEKVRDTMERFAREVLARGMRS